MTDMADNEEKDLSEQPLVSHLIELRDRILRSLLVTMVIFGGLFAFSNEIFDFFTAPLIRVMPEDSSTVILGIADGFFVPLKLTFFVAVAIAIPYLLHQAWAFIAPGLYKTEKRVAFPILVSSIILFYLGIAFAYFLVLGFTFAFFATIGPENANFMPDIARLVSFMLKVFLAFGICFEIPVAVVLLVMIGVLDPNTLTDKRPYVIVAFFTIAMFLTPADPFSLLLLAIPMCLLFEIGVIAGRIVHRDKKKQEEKKEEAEA